MKVYKIHFNYIGNSGKINRDQSTILRKTFFVKNNDRFLGEKIDQLKADVFGGKGYQWCLVGIDKK